MLLATYRKKGFNHSKRKPPPLSLQIKLLTRLYTLLQRGYPLLKALDIMTLDSSLRKMVLAIEGRLTNGLPLHTTFEEAGFSKYVVSYLYFSNSYGNVQQALLQSSYLLEKQQLFTASLRKALQYPLFLLVVMSTLLVFVKSTLLPSFLDLFSSMEINQSALLTLLHSMNAFLYGLLIFLFLSGLSLLLWKALSPRIPLSKRLSYYQRIPLCVTILKTETTFLFSYHLGSLLGAGLSIQNALKVMQQQGQFPILQWYAQHLYKDLSEGKSFAAILRDYPYFRKELSDMVMRNQTDGKLEMDLDMYAAWILEEAVKVTNTILKWIQPIMFLLLGGMILAIYGAIMMPMFQWMNQM
ncbi:competence type IV pilus assembly protein ComGB [Pontibacillus salicampi]|uniref:Competence type IV pilus assembly protein ComGB n=1 Tax=Pontibacillus salicampi TaxID=1449801 RepID=A0ABV6LJT9_9BACI